jgi:hypothetical protein
MAMNNGEHYLGTFLKHKHSKTTTVLTAELSWIGQTAEGLENPPFSSMLFKVIHYKSLVQPVVPSYTLLNILNHHGQGVGSQKNTFYPLHQSSKAFILTSKTCCWLHPHWR